MFKQSSETAKIIFPKLSNIKRITTPKHNFNRFNFDINNNNNKYLNKNTLCKKHQEPYPLLNFAKIVISIYARFVYILMIMIIH